LEAGDDPEAIEQAMGDLGMDNGDSALDFD
jgi:hypothetical protein